MKSENQISALVLDSLSRMAEVTMSRPYLNRLSAYLYWRTRGENLDDPERNGEYVLLSVLDNLFANKPNYVFDVGANIGDWCQNLRNALPNAKVIAIEPVSDTYVNLKNRFQNDSNVYCVNAALSDRDGKATINIEGKNSGSNSLHHVRELKWDRREEVNTLRGAHLAKQLNIQRIAMLKIDAEGHEIPILEGFREMIERGEIDIIQLEYNKTWIGSGTSLKTLFQLCAPEHYSLYKLRQRSLLHYSRYSQSLDNYCYSNWLVLHKSLIEAVKCKFSIIETNDRDW